MFKTWKYFVEKYTQMYWWGTSWPLELNWQVKTSLSSKVKFQWSIMWSHLATYCSPHTILISRDKSFHKGFHKFYQSSLVLLMHWNYSSTTTFKKQSSDHPLEYKVAKMWKITSYSEWWRVLMKWSVQECKIAIQIYWGSTIIRYLSRKLIFTRMWWKQTCLGLPTKIFLWFPQKGSKLRL